MKLISGGRISIARLALFIVTAALPVRGQEIEQSLDEEILKQTSALAPNSLLLPPATRDLVPPPVVQAAGKDFFRAWRTYVSIRNLASTAAQSPEAPVGKDLTNAATEWAKFNDLLRRCIESESPPDLSEFSRFNYADDSFCGIGSMMFSDNLEKGRTLVLLRQGKHLEVLQRLFGNPAPARDSLLRAFGIDPEELQLGAWLAETATPEVSCETGGELSARMLMDWVDLRFDVVLEKHRKFKATGIRESYDGPQFPAYCSIKLLRPDNGVTEESKARIAKFIETRGLELCPAEIWVKNCPEGAEKWVAGVARLGLTADLNEDRQRSSRLLDRAGIAHPKPEMRPGSRFSITVDRGPWPKKIASHQQPPQKVSMLLRSVSGYDFEVDLKLGPDGIYAGDFDRFHERGPLALAEFRSSPRHTESEPLGPGRPWLRGSVRLPLSGSEVNPIEIQTTGFTIRPTVLGEPRPNQEDPYEVEFNAAKGGMDERAPEYGGCRLTVAGTESLVLPHVSPGDYWIRIYHPGAVLAARKRIIVSATQNSYEPHLDRGACLVVPVEWPEMGDPATLPRDIERLIDRFSLDPQSNLPSMLVLKNKDGRVIQEHGSRNPVDDWNSDEYIRPAVAANGRFPQAAVFPYLPPGEYIVESPDWTKEPDGTNPGFAIKRSAINVVIREDSPVFVTSSPLKILYSRKE